MRRIGLSLLIVFAASAGRADAVTVRDLVELSRAGLSDQVLVALIEVEHSVFTLDTATLKLLKEGGVSDAVILAVVKSGRSPRSEPIAARPVATPEPESQPREPQVLVIDHHDAAAAAPAAPVAYPVAVPVYVPVPSDSRRYPDRTVERVLNTDQGLVRARVPVPANCVKAEPVYWGFGGKLRPDSWQPAPTLVCR